jgi:protein-S-isoprenylcysteine O-methyltransferase Ste14
MFRPIAIMLVVVSAILIVCGRVNHRSRWGDWIAVAGFAVLVLAGVLALLSGR